MYIIWRKCEDIYLCKHPVQRKLYYIYIYNVTTCIMYVYNIRRYNAHIIRVTHISYKIRDTWKNNIYI